MPSTAHLDLNTSCHTLGVGRGVLPGLAGFAVLGLEALGVGTVTVPLTALAWVFGVLISTSGLRREEGCSFHSLMVWSLDPLANNPPLSCSKHLCVRVSDLPLNSDNLNTDSLNTDNFGPCMHQKTPRRERESM